VNATQLVTDATTHWAGNHWVSERSNVESCGWLDETNNAMREVMFKDAR